MVNFEMFNEVGVEGGITVDSVRSFLNQNKKEDITFDISTLGGDLAQAITIHNLIKTHPGKTVANIIGLTASAGTVIAIACDEVVMSDNALFLIHNGWQQVTGNVYDLQKAASDLSKNDAIMVKIYREKTGLEDQKIRDIMKASDWLSSEEAVKYKFVDRVSKSNQKIAASVTEAQRGYLSQILINKLEKKMNIFGKKETKVLNLLSLKGGKNLLINAEVAAEGVEVAPLGAMTLEDGEYELSDGRKIIVAGGVITSVTEVEAGLPDAKKDEEEVIAAVTDIVATEINKIRAEFTKALSLVSSTHVPPKGTVDNSKIPVVSVQSKIQSITDGIRNKIVESRKA